MSPLPACSGKVIKAIIDTLLVVDGLSPERRKLFKYDKFSDVPQVADKVIAAININLPFAEQLETGLVFAALNTVVGTCALGMGPYLKSFPELSFVQRTAVLVSLRVVVLILDGRHFWD